MIVGGRLRENTTEALHERKMVGAKGLTLQRAALGNISNKTTGESVADGLKVCCTICPGIYWSCIHMLYNMFWNLLVLYTHVVQFELEFIDLE